MINESEVPKEWRFENGAFIGHVLVSREVNPSPTGMKTKVDDWMPFAFDLRHAHCLKQYSFEEPFLTALYHNNEFIGCVNVRFTDLMPEWLKARSVYDEPIAR